MSEQLPKRVQPLLEGAPQLARLSSPEKPTSSHTLPKTAILLGLGRENALLGEPLSMDHLADVNAAKIDYEALTQLTLKSREEHWHKKEAITVSMNAREIYNKYGVNPEDPHANPLDIWTAITAEQLFSEKDTPNFRGALQRFGITEFDNSDNPKELQAQIEKFWEKYLNEDGQSKGHPEVFVNDFVAETTGETREILLTDLDAIAPLLGAWGEPEAIRDAILLKAGVTVPENEDVLTHDVEHSYHPRLLKIQKQLAGVPDTNERRDVVIQAHSETVKADLAIKEGEFREVDPVVAIAGAKKFLQIPAAGETSASENAPSAEVQKQPLTNESWIAARIKDILEKPENEKLREWYEAQMALLSDMRTSEVPATSMGGWSNELLETDGKREVQRIHGQQFDVIGRQITLFNPDGTQITKKIKKMLDGVEEEVDIPAGWEQPVLVNNNPPENIQFMTPQGEVSLDVSGFVGLLVDEEGKVAISLGNEPGAQTPKKVLVRTPVQASIAKFQQLLDGDTSKDPVLGKVLQRMLPEGKTLADLIAEGGLVVSPLLLADANRIDAKNITFKISIPNDLRDELVADRKIRMASHDELDVLAQSGLMNGHLATALRQQNL